MYISYYIDALVSAPWQDAYRGSFYYVASNPILIAPIIMKNPGNVNSTILMEMPPSNQVREGDELANQPKIALKDNLTGSPISNVGCVAFIKGKNNDTYPRGYKFAVNSIYKY